MNNDWQDSWGTNEGTAFGAIFSTSSKLGSHAGSFDGVDDKITVPNHSSLNITDNLTVGAWAYNSSFDLTYSSYLIAKEIPGSLTTRQYDLSVGIDKKAS